MRRPGKDCAGVGVGCVVWGDGDDAAGEVPAVRGRESTGCCAVLARAIMNENTALRLVKSTNVLRCARKNGKMRSLITAKPSVKKRLMANYFRSREEHELGHSISRKSASAHVNDAGELVVVC